MESQDISRFLANPEVFSGTSSGINPLSWFKQFDRVRRAAIWSDEQALLVVGSYFRGQAQMWWDALEDSIHTWSAFEDAFKAKYIAGQDRDAWWTKIETMKQGVNESVEEVAGRLQDLFQMVGKVEEGFKIHYLLRAIRPEIAYELEKLVIPDQFATAVKEAVKVEQVMRKYGRIDGADNLSVVRGGNLSSQSSLSGRIDHAPSLVPEDSISSQLSELVEGFKALKVHLVENANRAPVFKCYHCGKEGHTKTKCPQLKSEDNQGKDKGRQ